MATKTLLLDIDGVVVRDHLLMAHVRENCVNYVRAKLPESKNPHVSNDLLYRGYGHTARGLSKGFGIDTRDFNSAVYTKRLLTHLTEVLETDAFQREAAEIYELTRDGWNIQLFTNAPWAWASKVAIAIGDDVAIRCPGNPCDSPLKPEAEAYRFQTEGPTVMVDDSIRNLITAQCLMNWHCIHFSEGASPRVANITDMCSAVRGSVKNLV
jgi:hypothetical protein